MKTQRLFFGLWPTEEVRQAVVNKALPYTKNLDGKIIKPQNLHITLHFLGHISEDVKEQMLDAARTVTAESFDIDMNCFGYFPRPKIFWMGAQQVPVELIQLHEKLGDALSECGYECDKRPFSPHVTLMRKCAKPLIRDEKFTTPWTVDEFVLLESIPDVSGVNYRVLEQYPLS